MGTRKFSALKWFFTVIPPVWGVLAFVAWHEVAQCGQMFGLNCSTIYREGLIQFVSLSWLWDYQTLVAGLGAFIGARLVLSAAKITAENNIEVQRRSASEAHRVAMERQKAAALEACTLVRSDFREAIKQLQRKSEGTVSAVAKQHGLFTRTSTYMGTLVSICPQLALIVAARISEVHFALASYERDDIIKEQAHCEVIFSILEGVSDHLSDDGKYDLDHARKFSAEHVRASLRRIGYRLEDILGLAYYFDPET